MGTVLLWLIALAIMLAIVATGMAQGLWNNVIRLINVVTAALLATSLFETVAGMLRGVSSSYDVVWDIIAIWMLFAVFLVIFRIATGFASRTMVRFKKPVDLAGGAFFALWTGWVMVCFTMTTLHVAPLARNCFGGAFQPTPNSTMLMLGPDRKWLAFVRKASLGSFSSIFDAKEHVFDPNGDFILRYAARRSRSESAKTMRMVKDVHWNAFRELRVGMGSDVFDQWRTVDHQTGDSLFEERTFGETTIWTFGPYSQYSRQDKQGRVIKLSGGRRFKVRVHFTDDRLTFAYMMWEMKDPKTGEVKTNFFAKDESSAIGE